MPDDGSGGVSLLAGGGDQSGLMSLLAPFVSGGVATPNNPGSMAGAVPAFLAFAARMAEAGRPTLGPPTPLTVALPEALSAGASAAMQGQTLPIIQQQAAREAQMQDVRLKQEQFQLQRAMGAWNLGLSLLGAGGAPPGAGAAGAPGVTAQPAAPGGGAAANPQPPASTDQIAQLPDVMALPDAIRPAFIAAGVQAGATPDSAAQFARMIKQESGGLHTDPATGKIITSTAGAQGVTQTMPATFGDMAQKYNIGGSNTDLVPNMQAGFRYFQEGTDQGLRNAAIRYSAGPNGLKNYLANGTMPAETADYLAKIGAPPAAGGALPAPVTVAGPGAPGGGTVAPVPTNAEPMVYDPVVKQMVPQGIYNSAHAAQIASMMTGAGDAGLAAHNEIITKYNLQRAGQGTYTQLAPGIQVSSVSGQASVAPAGTPSEQIMTPEQVAAIPSLDPRMTYSQTVRPDGSVEKYQVIAPRQAFAQLDQEKNMRAEYLDDPVVKTYQGALPYLTRMQGILAQGQERDLQQPDDYALLKNYAHLNDPNAVVKAGDEGSIYEGAGIPGDIKQAWARVAGGGTLLPEQRQWLLDSARSEMGGQEAAAYQVLMEKRRLAGEQGIRQDQIAIPWNLSSYARTALAATPPGAATPGAPTQGAGNPPLTIPRPGFVPSAQLPGGRQIAAQPAAAPGGGTVAPQIAPGAVQPPGGMVTPAAPLAPPAAPPGPAATVAPKLTPGQLKALSPAGMANLGAALQANRGQWADADVAAYLAEAEARRRAAAR
jgi:hypothetical protein